MSQQRKLCRLSCWILALVMNDACNAFGCVLSYFRRTNGYEVHEERRGRFRAVRAGAAQSQGSSAASASNSNGNDTTTTTTTSAFPAPLSLATNGSSGQRHTAHSSSSSTTAARGDDAQPRKRPRRRLQQVPAGEGAAIMQSADEARARLRQETRRQRAGRSRRVTTTPASSSSSPPPPSSSSTRSTAAAVADPGSAVDAAPAVRGQRCSGGGRGEEHEGADAIARAPSPPLSLFGDIDDVSAAGCIWARDLLQRMGHP